jgi:carotenoid cleavage dioxygenase-like enzyme
MLLLLILYPCIITFIDAAAFLSRPTSRSFSHTESSALRSYNQAAKHSDGTSDDFWHQPLSRLKSLLSSLPPKEILDRIRDDPYKGGFEPVSDFNEVQIPNIIYGSIPDDLVGTLAVNGPGRIRIGGRLLGHWFDGDGFISTFSFDGRSNHVRVFGRYVRTDRFVAQETQDKYYGNQDQDPEFKPPLAFSGAWTKAGNGKFFENLAKIPQNPSNTAVMWLPPLNGLTPRLFALCEGGHPIEVDPRTLEVLRREQPFKSSPSAANRDVVSSFFSAHFSLDPNDNTIYNHGYKLDLIAAPSINVLKLSSTGDLLQQEKCEMPYNTFVHDSTISHSFLVYIVCPYLMPSGLDLIPFVFGKAPLGGLMEWRGGHSSNDLECLKSYLHVHSKDDLKLKWRIDIPHPMSVFHLADAFEEEHDSEKIWLKIRVAELKSSNPPCNRPLIETQFANQYEVPSGTRLHSTLKEYAFELDNDGYGEGRFLYCRDIADKTRDSIPCDYPATNPIAGYTRPRYTWVNTLPLSNNDNNDRKATSDWFNAVQKIDMEDRYSSLGPVTFGEGVVRFFHC